MALIAITGTPGTGKTTLGDALERMGKPVLRLSSYLERERKRDGGCTWQTWDDVNDTHVVDQAAMVKVLGAEIAAASAGRIVFMEGLLSYFFESPMVIVTRCRPDLLLERIRGRKWKRAKVRENVEGEYTGAIVSDLLALKRLFLEADTTSVDPAEVAKEICSWGDSIAVAGAGAGPGKTLSPPGSIDWLELDLPAL